jgi:uncharacterized membrane protein YczE
VRARGSDRDERRRDPWRRLPGLIAGLLLFGAAVAIMARAGLGLSPWETFHQGISRQTGVPMGTVSILLGLPILLLWLPLGARPGLGTLLNVVLIGTTTNLVLAIVPSPADVAQEVLLFALGLGTLAIGSGMYLGADLGAGPRDGLFTAVHRRTGWRIAYVRASIELTVLGAGVLLGGTLGVGTIVFALTIGHLTEWSLRIFDRDGRVMRRRVASEPEALLGEGAA